MKKTIQSVIVIIAAIIGFGANAQTKSEANSLLWEVSGNGLTKPSYLYGTVHMICESDFKMTDKTRKAFGKTSKLALEVDMDDPSELAVMQQSAMGKEPLNKALSAEDYQKLDVFLKEKLGQSVTVFENYSLTTIMSMVMLKSLACPPKVYELEFMKMAADKKMEIIGLEKITAQLEFLDKAYSSKEIIGQLQQYDADYFKKLISDYNSEQIQKIYQMTIDPKFMDAEDKKWLLDIRNKNWVAKMPELMKHDSIFFAVGAAHLEGNLGVIRLLKNAGYVVKPVMN